ncbi:hypothetical protein L915_10541, partial [Phytophthora nicotianae]
MSAAVFFFFAKVAAALFSLMIDHATEAKLRITIIAATTIDNPIGGPYEFFERVLPSEPDEPVEPEMAVVQRGPPHDDEYVHSHRPFTHFPVFNSVLPKLPPI